MGIYVVKRATRLPGTPHSIAAGAACGVASSFTPFIGLHLLGSFLLCLLVRGNYLAAVVGTLVGNPWTLPFIWVTAYHLGHALLGTHGPQLEAVQHWDLATLMGELEAVFWPVAVGERSPGPDRGSRDILPADADDRRLPASTPKSARAPAAGPARRRGARRLVGCRVS